MKRKWVTAANVAVPRPLSGDEKLWWYYSLYLICNRHVADCVDDQTVSEALNKMAARIELPFDH